MKLGDAAYKLSLWNNELGSDGLLVRVPDRDAERVIRNLKDYGRTDKAQLPEAAPRPGHSFIIGYVGEALQSFMGIAPEELPVEYLYVNKN